MRKVILTNVPISGEVISPYRYGLLDCPIKAIPLPTYHAEVIHIVEVANRDVVAMHW